MSSELTAGQLVGKFRHYLVVHRYALRTEESYLGWVRRYLRFQGAPESWSDDWNGTAGVIRYLESLIVEDRVNASTQNQALNALVLFFRVVLEREAGDVSTALRARRSRRLPTVLSRDEVRALLQEMSGSYRLMAELLYGSGLRVSECLRLRVKDVDMARGTLAVRSGKGDKDRWVPLARTLQLAIERHLGQVRYLYDLDVAQGQARVYLPEALERKWPGAGSEWAWQWFFPATQLSLDPRSGKQRRHHVEESSLQKQVSRCARRVVPHKRVTCHALRHSFATRCATLSPRICWKAAATSAPSKICSATAMCPPP